MGSKTSSTYFQSLRQVYIVLSVFLFGTYLIPVIGYIPMAVIVLCKLKQISPELYKGSLSKIVFLIFIFEVFLSLRIYFYYVLKFSVTRNYSTTS